MTAGWPVTTRCVAVLVEVVALGKYAVVTMGVARPKRALAAESQARKQHQTPRLGTLPA
jgi:hypothetical protein